MPENLRVFVPDPDGLNSYPIVTFSWILLRKNYQNAETVKAVRELFQRSLRDGQQYAPSSATSNCLPRSLKAKAALDSIKAEG
jgi:phosphate transport system substrate-binding protein